jgi:hypothetical protein
MHFLRYTVLAIGLAALSLGACGGSSTPAETTPAAAPITEPADDDYGMGGDDYGDDMGDNPCEGDDPCAGDDWEDE